MNAITILLIGSLCSSSVTFSQSVMCGNYSTIHNQTCRDAHGFVISAFCVIIFLTLLFGTK